MRLRVQSLALLSGLSCRELWCRSRCSLDLLLLWLWCRPVAVAVIRPLAWEPPYAMGTAQEMAKKRPKKKKKKKKTKRRNPPVPSSGSTVSFLSINFNLHITCVLLRLFQSVPRLFSPRGHLFFFLLIQKLKELVSKRLQRSSKVT